MFLKNSVFRISFPRIATSLVLEEIAKTRKWVEMEQKLIRILGCDTILRKDHQIKIFVDAPVKKP